MDIYGRLRISTPPEIGVNPIHFLDLYERYVGEAPDVDLLIDQLTSMDSVHLGEMASKARKRREESTKRGGKGASGDQKRGIGG